MSKVLNLPEPGMPDTAIISRFDLGTSWNLAQVFLTNLSTCSSMVANVCKGRRKKLSDAVVEICMLVL